MRIRTLYSVLSLLAILSITSCGIKKDSQGEMVGMLQQVNNAYSINANKFCSKAKLLHVDSLLRVPNTAPNQIRYSNYLKATILLETGEEDRAIEIFEKISKDDPTYQIEILWQSLALAYLRKGERSNCIANHASESCLLPIRGMGQHRDLTGSTKAIAIYEKLLALHPDDLESRWLLNIAYMTLGKYPKGVPVSLLIPDMEGDTTFKVNAFADVAADLKLDVNNMAGGSIADDFDNDGYIDLVTSGWDLGDEIHYFKNNANGTFSDVSDKTKLKGITGGLNIMQADYNNDGYKDILILRGAWKGEMGREPNSLLKNNGDGTFTDVTTISGLLSFHPTQTATWNDFNNDGWLDLFIGNETSVKELDAQHPCELYISNQDGTFTEMAASAKCDVIGFVKGVTSGDYDNDGLKDIFISTMDGNRILLKNTSKGKVVLFENVTSQAGLDKDYSRSFPTWFWDYNNDGWLDIFACDYTYDKTLAYYAAAEKLNIAAGNEYKMLLYRNNKDGTFTNVAKEAGLTKNVFAMGSNFGDIDNDGYLDMYLGSGNPRYESLVPNKMFKNIGGEKFVDVTASARVGHLQKGHAVSFADLDNDGDQDIYCDMGGTYIGDTYQNSLFLNPGQGSNNWICVSLEGRQSNRSAIGTRVKITLTERGIKRSVYRDVNSGGSFGASPLRREIGIGQATQIDELEIHWHGSNDIQIFKNIKPNQFLKITEGSRAPESVKLKTINWTLPDKLCLPTI